jgi:hypothetical protein
MTLARTFSNRPIHRRWVIPLINQTKCTNNTIQKLLHNLSRPVTVRGATDQKENGLSRRKSTSRVQCCTTNPSSESLHSSKQLIQCPQTISPCRINVSCSKHLSPFGLYVKSRSRVNACFHGPNSVTSMYSVSNHATFLHAFLNCYN